MRQAKKNHRRVLWQRRYQEVDAKDNPIDAGEFKLGTMYVRKSALPKEPPENIVVVIGKA